MTHIGPRRYPPTACISGDSHVVVGAQSKLLSGAVVGAQNQVLYSSAIFPRRENARRRRGEARESAARPSS